jgi:hypothetical protein
MGLFAFNIGPMSEALLHRNHADPIISDLTAAADKRRVPPRLPPTPRALFP